MTSAGFSNRILCMKISKPGREGRDDYMLRKFVIY
jgi:hypothetical protein